MLPPLCNCDPADETLDDYNLAVHYLKDGENRVRPGPGKFEACHDRRIAEILSGMDTDEDEGSVTESPWLWVGRIGQFIVREDSYGFFDYQDMETEDSAKGAFQHITSGFIMVD